MPRKKDPIGHCGFTIRVMDKNTGQMRTLNGQEASAMFEKMLGWQAESMGVSNNQGKQKGGEGK